VDPTPIFVLQFVWFLAAWSTLAVLFVAPKLRDYEADDALSI
jgi:hypothetical protein